MFDSARSGAHLWARPRRRAGFAAAVRDAAGGAVAHAARVGAPGRFGGLHLRAGCTAEGAPRGRPNIILRHDVRTLASECQERSAPL